VINLRSNPDFLAAVSRYTIRDDLAILRLLRCTCETSLDGVRSVVDNKCACWQYLLRWLTVAWHLLNSLDRFNVLGISSNGAPSHISKAACGLRAAARASHTFPTSLQMPSLRQAYLPASQEVLISFHLTLMRPLVLNLITFTNRISDLLLNTDIYRTRTAQTT